MKCLPAIGLFIALCGCALKSRTIQSTTQATDTTDPNSIQSLHIRLTVNPQDGSVTYFGWYDGRRNLLGENGITAALVGMEPPDFRESRLDKPNPHELRFTGRDHNHIHWQKTYRLDPGPAENKVHVTHRITNRRDQPFEAIIYSLADLPDARITGDNRDLHIITPTARAHFHALLENPNFPGEQMSPYAMRSDSKPLHPGASMEFAMTWELQPVRSTTR